MSEIDYGRFTPEEVSAFWDRMVAENPIDDDSDELDQFVVFRLGKAWFAVESRYCRGVEPFRPPSPLPVLPAHIMGVAAVRGRPVSVTDIGIFFGQKPAERSGHLLIINAGGEETALKADWVDAVTPLDISEMVNPPSRWQGLRTGLVRGAVERKNTLVLVLDAERCIKAPEVQS